MAYRVVVTSKAKIDLSKITTWWAEHRSAEQAVRWLAGWKPVFRQLSVDPRQSPLARESDLLGFEVRNVFYGLNRKKTHRAVFTISESIVYVHAVRHLAQDDLKKSDFEI